MTAFNQLYTTFIVPGEAIWACTSCAREHEGSFLASGRLCERVRTEEGSADRSHGQYCHDKNGTWVIGDSKVCTYRH